MTDDEIKAVVERYILNNFDDDNADGLHEYDAWYASIDEDPGELLKRAYKFYRDACLIVVW